MSDNNIKGDAFYLNENKDKSADNHPDYKGNLEAVCVSATGPYSNLQAGTGKQ